MDAVAVGHVKRFDWDIVAKNWGEDFEKIISHKK